MTLFTCMALFVAKTEGSGSEAEQARRVESVWLPGRSREREREGGAVLLEGGCMEEEENGPTPMHVDTACWSSLAQTGSRSFGAEDEGKLVRGRGESRGRGGSRSEAEGKLVRGRSRPRGSSEAVGSLLKSRSLHESWSAASGARWSRTEMGTGPTRGASRAEGNSGRAWSGPMHVACMAEELCMAEGELDLWLGVGCQALPWA